MLVSLVTLELLYSIFSRVLLTSGTHAMNSHFPEPAPCSNSARKRGQTSRFMMISPKACAPGLLTTGGLCDGKMLKECAKTWSNVQIPEPAPCSKSAETQNQMGELGIPSVSAKHVSLALQKLEGLFLTRSCNQERISAQTNDEFVRVVPCSRSTQRQGQMSEIM